MQKRPRKRRTGTTPHRTYWSAEAVTLIDTFQAQHQIASFSAAAETLVRLGVQQSPAEVLTPVVASAIKHALHHEFARLIKLQVYTAIEAGMAQRFAAAAVRDVGRLKHDDPDRFTRIREAAIADTRRRLHRDNISAIIADVYAELTDDGHAPPVESTTPSAANDVRGGR